MTDKYILDERGQPQPIDDLIAWARWFEVADRHVARTEIGNVRVSTVFLGLDHRFVGSGPPILWETMVFGGKHDQFQERATSREEALEHHANAVCLVIDDLTGGTGELR